MSLRYFIPQSSVQPHIRSFSVIEEPGSVFNKRIILPDSYPALLINLGSPFVWETGQGNQVELPAAFFVGVQTQPLKIRATGPCHAIGLSLSAWATRFVVNEHVDLTTRPIVALEGAWRDLTRLLKATVNHQDHVEGIATLQQFVSDLHSRTRIDVKAIRVAVELLYTTKGQSSLNELAAHCYLSPSQLERNSKYLTGRSPKTLARLIRFDAACACLANNPSPRLTDVAQQFGYSDQAHFIHEFKALAAFTPGEIVAYIQQLAADAEFIQFS